MAMKPWHPMGGELGFPLRHFIPVIDWMWTWTICPMLIAHVLLCSPVGWVGCSTEGPIIKSVCFLSTDRQQTSPSSFLIMCECEWVLNFLPNSWSVVRAQCANPTAIQNPNLTGEMTILIWIQQSMKPMQEESICIYASNPFECLLYWESRCVRNHNSALKITNLLTDWLTTTSE